MSDRDRSNEELLEEISRLKRKVAELEECAAGQKRAEASLRQCRARLKEVQRLSHIAQWQVDLQTGEAFWSDEDYRILGYEPGEVKASWDIMLKHIHPDDMHIIEEGREKMLAEGEFESEYRIIQKNGSVRNVYSKNLIEYDSAGNPLLLRGIFRDITEQKPIS
jgi:PAS domain S-box-containing protein